MKRRLRVRLLLLFSLAMASTLSPVRAVSESAPILFLSGHNGSSRATDTIAAFTETWERTEPGVRILTQLLAAFSFPPSPEALTAMRAAIVERLRASPPRLIVAHGDLALETAVALRDEVFSSSAIVGIEITENTARIHEDARRTRLLAFADFRKEIIGLALQVLPELRTVHIMQNYEPTVEAARRLRNTFPDLNIDYIIDPSPAKTDEVLKSSGAHEAVICFSPGWFNERGRFITGREFIQELTKRYNAPIFDPIKEDMEAGLAGGVGLARADWGKAAAVLGLGLLSSTEENAPRIETQSLAGPFLNYAALDRFGVRIRKTPPGIEVINRPQPFWIRYQRALQAMILVMALALVGLVVSIVIRYRVSYVLRWANERLELQVAERTSELSTANEELNAVNANLTTALSRAEAMQEAMLKSARESLLGRLAASFANELNSPLNAIASANEASMDVLKDARAGLGPILQGFDAAQRALFDRYVEVITSARYNASSGGYGSTRELESILSAAPNPDAAETAADLLDCGLGTLSKEELAAFARIGSREVAAALYRLSVIFRSGYIIEEAVRNAAAAVTAVRAYSGSMSVESDSREFDVGSSIERALSLFRDKLDASYTIEKNFRTVAVVRGDEAAIIRMWTHLIQNALEAMPSGGVLTLDLSEQGAGFRVAFGDTGVGIEPAVRDHLFEAFATTKTAAEGLGLGLAYCKRVVESIGGSIDYETGDTGTVFIVTLPGKRKSA